MADEDESSKAGKASGKAATRSRRAPETKSTAQTKRAAPTRRKPRQAAPTAQAAKGSPNPENAETKAAAQEASERERLSRAKLAEALDEDGRRVMAKSRTYLREGVNAMAAAAAATRLGRAAARAGAKDVLDGTQVLMASQDIAAQSLAVEALSTEDLDLGLALAGMAGQLGAMTAVVDSLSTGVIAEFLDTRSEQLKQLAESLILRAGATGALAKTLAETSGAMAELGETEVAEGEAEFATSEEEAAEGEELAGTGLGLMMMGVAEAVEAEGFQEEADKIAQKDSAEAAEGGAASDKA